MLRRLLLLLDAVMVRESQPASQPLALHSTELKNLENRRGGTRWNENMDTGACYVSLNYWIILLTVASALISFVWARFSHFCHTELMQILREISCSLREAGGTFGHSSQNLLRRWTGQLFNVCNNFTGYRITTSYYRLR